MAGTLPCPVTTWSLETAGWKISEELSFPSEKYVETEILMRIKLSQAGVYFLCEIIIFLIIFKQAHLERHQCFHISFSHSATVFQCGTLLHN